MKHKTMKCSKCGWVHAVIGYKDALAHHERNANSAKSLARLFGCFSCGASTEGFVPAEPGDAPLGATLQAAVVLGLQKCWSH